MSYLLGNAYTCNSYLKWHRFPNDPCPSGEPGYNGTCYTDEQCRKRKGFASGGCANGFGICCIRKYLS